MKQFFTPSKNINLPLLHWQGLLCLIQSQEICSKYPRTPDIKNLEILKF